MKFFSYTREVKVKKLDESGNPIPKQVDVDPTKIVQEAKPIEYETETKYFEDFFDIERVIRGVSTKENQMVILLDDGHEVTEATPRLKDPRKAATPSNVQYEKQRNWVQSEITLTGDDAERFRKVYKAYSV